MHKRRLKTILEAAEAQCQLRGTRLTNKRKSVLSALLKSAHATTAYELIDFCKADTGESFPAMSIYRILDFLESAQLVHKLKLANRYVACIHISCDHQHAAPQFLICHECYRVEEIDITNSVLGKLKKSVESAGYALTSRQIELECVCAGCSAK